jgi:large subunit ribosomal protein L21
MFAIVRTGGKQYRVAPGDKIAVEKLAGEAGDSVTLGDILLAGDGTDIKDSAGLTVAAEIVAQAKGDKVVVFKKRRRHNYRRKQGHRQQYTILKIVSVGGQGEKQQSASDAAATPAPTAEASTAPAADTAPVAANTADTATETSTPDAAPAKAAAKKTTKAK